MDDAAILRIRVDGLLDQIAQGRAALARINARQPRLFGRISPVFEQTLGAQDDKMKDLKRALADGLHPPDPWHQLAEARTMTGPVFADIHTFVQGVEAREAGLDRGVLDLADALLDELSQASEYKARMTVLSDREYYGVLAEMIRLRFPDTTFWMLPILVHEFGHFLAATLRVDEGGAKVHPLQAIAERANNDSERRRLQELVADVFASFAVGPAYGFTCVVLRWDRTPREQFGEHPSSSVRVDAILRALSAFKPDHAYRDLYEVPMERIRALWDSLPPPANGDAPGTTVADGELLDANYDAIEKALRAWFAPARYRSFAAAEALRPLLSDENAVGNADGATLTDILNAAWMGRVLADENRKTIERIEQRAVAMMNARILAAQPAAMAAGGGVG